MILILDPEKVLIEEDILRVQELTILEGFETGDSQN